MFRLWLVGQRLLLFPLFWFSKLTCSISGCRRPYLNLLQADKTILISCNITEKEKVHAVPKNSIDSCWTHMQCVDVDGLCASKYANEEMGCCIISEKVEMTLGLFTEIVLMGWVGICYIVNWEEGCICTVKGAIYYDKLKRIITNESKPT